MKPSEAWAWKTARTTSAIHHKLRTGKSSTSGFGRSNPTEKWTTLQPVVSEQMAKFVLITFLFGYFVRWGNHEPPLKPEEVECSGFTFMFQSSWAFGRVTPQTRLGFHPPPGGC